MSEQPIEIVSLEPLTVAVLRESVPVSGLVAYYDRAYHAVAEAMGAQGVQFAGPPVGVYFGRPSESADVAAGFPFTGTFEPRGPVTAITLPSGRAVQVLHVGSYDSMAQTYDRVSEWVRDQGLELADVVWETYLTQPTPDGDASSMQTSITWPLRD